MRVGKVFALAFSLLFLYNNSYPYSVSVGIFKEHCVQHCSLSSADPYPHVFIATLGSEPQVVTAALDLLLARRAPIGEVVVLHTACDTPPITAAVEALRADAAEHVYAHRLTFGFAPICAADGRPLADVETPEASQAGFQALYGAIHRAKRAGRQVYLSIAGGRKNLAVYGLVAAQLLFDEDDSLWHLYSAGDFLASRRLHPEPGDEVHLLPIPVLLRSYISPALTGLRHVQDAAQALDHFQRLALEDRLADCRAFVLGSLTPAEWRAVQLLVRQGLSDNEIAARLNVSPRTVEQQLRSAYAKAGDHWQIEAVGRAQLIALLNLYGSLTEIGEIPHDNPSTPG